MTKSKPADIFLIAGGPKSKNTKTILAEALEGSKKKSPNVAYIGTASDDNKEFFLMLRPIIMAAGAGSVTLVPIVRRFDPDKARDILLVSDVVFISGGDVDLGMKYLRKRNFYPISISKDNEAARRRRRKCIVHTLRKPTTQPTKLAEESELGLVPFFRELYNRGILFCGISAGAIMLCRNWMHWRDPDDDDTAELLDCLGFAPLLCDVHAEEDNWVEMKRLLGFFPQGTAGYGIPAEGALRVAPDGKITSIGSVPVRFIKKGADIIIV
jgi:peptidase E